MAETPRTGGETINTSAGHLSVHVEGQHPDDVHFLFEERKGLAPSLVVALLYHLAFIGFIAYASTQISESTTAEAILPDAPNDQIIWLAQPGPGGGGGGGGNQMKEPPRQVELPGKDKITVPVAKAPTLEVPKEEKKVVEQSPLENLNIPAQSLASAAESLPGVLEAPPGPPSNSLGSGRGGGAGTGTGTGIGSGTGSGLGAGMGGGTGGGVYRLGSGVTTPVVITQPPLRYTPEAMRARVQGSVFLSCIVRPDGSVSDVAVIRSLDRAFGLDDEAVKNLRSWRFRPATLRGETVSVRIEVELMFNIR